MIAREIKETFELFETLFKWRFTEPVCKDFVGFKWSYDIFTKNGLGLTKQQVKQAYAKLKVFGYETIGSYEVECYFINNKRCSSLQNLMLKTFYQAFIFCDEGGNTLSENVIEKDVDGDVFEKTELLDFLKVQLRFVEDFGSNNDSVQELITNYLNNQIKALEHGGVKKGKKQQPNAILLFKKLLTENLKLIISHTNDLVSNIFDDSFISRSYYAGLLDNTRSGVFIGNLSNDKVFKFVDINKHTVQVIYGHRVFFLVDDIYQLFVHYLNSHNNDTIYRDKPLHFIERLKEKFPNGINDYKFGAGNDFVDELFISYYKGKNTLFNFEGGIGYIFKNKVKPYRLTDKAFIFELV